MPYYAWKGVDMYGSTQRGRNFAASPHLLDEYLRKSDIAVISQRPVSTMFVRYVNSSSVVDFFEKMATLLEAGVFVPESLVLMRDTIGHVGIQLVLEELVGDVERGISLSVAMARHKRVFADRIVHMIYAGQESGRLAVVVRALARHLATVGTFRASVRAAAAGPLISCAFFVVVTVVIAVNITPMLACILDSAQQEIPPITRIFLSLGEFLRSWQGIAVVAITFLGCSTFVRWLNTKERFCRLRDTAALNVPIIGAVMRDTQRAWFFDILALLVEGGVRLVPALLIAESSCTNVVIEEHVRMVRLAVSSGSSLSSAMEQCQSGMFTPEIIATVRISEATGSLAPSLQRAGRVSRERAMKSLSLVVHMVQPVLLIFLGLMITLLIMAVYAPIFTLSQGIA